MTKSRPYAPQDPYGPPQPHEWQHGAGRAPQRGPRPGFGPAPGPGFGPVRAPGYGGGFGPGPAYGPGPAFGPVRPPDHDRYAFVAPLIATVLGGPVIAFCGMIAMISPMATDSCTAKGCQELTTMLLVAPVVLLLAAMALGLSWLLPWRLRHRTARVAASVAAPLLAATTLLIYFNLPAAT